MNAVLNAHVGGRLVASMHFVRGKHESDGETFK